MNKRYVTFVSVKFRVAWNALRKGLVKNLLNIIGKHVLPSLQSNSYLTNILSFLLKLASLQHGTTQ